MMEAPSPMPHEDAGKLLKEQLELRKVRTELKTTT